MRTLLIMLMVVSLYTAGFSVISADARVQPDQGFIPNEAFRGVFEDADTNLANNTIEYAALALPNGFVFKESKTKGSFDRSVTVPIIVQGLEKKAQRALAQFRHEISVLSQVQFPKINLPDIEYPRMDFPDFSISHFWQVSAEAKQAPSLFNQLSPIQQQQSWVADQQSIDVEAVLVPGRLTIVSSSHDGRIIEMPYSHGDSFKAGDVLVRYSCKDIEAEAEIIAKEREISYLKAKSSKELFDLNVLSYIERMDLEGKDAQTASKKKAIDAKLDSCQIRADFNGRVTKRLANTGEYTRTDRVLMEVVSDDALQVEFILPSKWLRWVNKGAPISVKISETERVYEANISRIYGQVDPVSQSIQMVATLMPYEDNLLPGMSGKVSVDLSRIQEAGIKGYLQATRAEE